MPSRHVYTVREFDYLVSCKENPDLTNSAYIANSVPLKKETRVLETDFLGLKDYLLANIKDEGNQMFKAVRLSSKNRVGEALQVKNYVGVIEIPNGTRFEILPKIFNGNVELGDRKEIETILLKMLSSLKDFPAAELGDASLNLTSLNLFEVFVRIFLTRVKDLVKKGLRNGYTTIEENSSAYRGRLLVHSQIKYNAVHQERFYISRDEYNLNRPENRLLKAAINKLMKVSESPESVSLCRQLLPYFDGAEDTDDFESDYRTIVFDNGNRSYLSVVQWSMVFLRNKTFSIFGGENRGQALLFPMDSIFEKYVASQIRRLIKVRNKAYGLNWSFKAQETSNYLFDVPRSFRIRPDIDIKPSDSVSIILDTKWKGLSIYGKGQYGISDADMYQVYAYSKRYQSPNVYLLYPESEASLSKKSITYEAHDRSGDTKVELGFIDLVNMVAFQNKTDKDVISPDNKLNVFLEKLFLELNGPKALSFVQP